MVIAYSYYAISDNGLNNLYLRKFFVKAKLYKTNFRKANYDCNYVIEYFEIFIKFEVFFYSYFQNTTLLLEYLSQNINLC